MRQRNISLIISKCVKSWDPLLETYASYRSYGEAKEVKFDSLEEAMKKARTKIAEGMSVLVRPNYNENEDDGEKRFFREWRSFNGGELKEIRFSY